MVDLLIIVNYLPLILISMTIFYLLTLIRSSIVYIKFRTETNRQLIIAVISLGFGITYDSLRILLITIFRFNFELLDKSFFCVKVFLILMTYSVLGRLFFKYSELSGHNIKNGVYIQLFFIVIMAIFSVLNCYTFFSCDFGNQFGFYIYMVNPLLRILIYSLYFPFFLFIISKSRVIFREIKNNKMRKKSIIMVTFLIILMLERLLSLGYFVPFSGSILTFIVDFALTSILLICLCISVFMYADLFEEISTYFKIKSVSLIGKNGILIYEFDFQKERSQDLFSSKNILLGGFIDGINDWLQKYFEISGEINTIDLGNINLLIKHSKYVFGILFVSEYTPILIHKLSNFIKKFEDSYEKELKNWIDDITIFDSTRIQKWVEEIFR